MDLISGSIGAILALIGKELIEIYKSKRDFKRSIQKEMFLKKLDSSTEGIAFLNSFISVISQIQYAYKVMSEEEEFNSDFFLRTIIEKEKELLKLHEKSRERFFSINLFYEIENEELWTEEDEIEYLKGISEFLSLIDITVDMQERVNEYYDEGDIGKGDRKAIEIQETMIPKFKDIFQRLSEILEKNKKAVTEIRKIIREDFKKYKY